MTDNKPDAREIAKQQVRVRWRNEPPPDGIALTAVELHDADVEYGDRALRCVVDQINTAGCRIPRQLFIPWPDTDAQYQLAKYFIRTMARKFNARRPKIFANPFVATTQEKAETDLIGILEAYSEKFERIDGSDGVSRWRLRPDASEYETNAEKLAQEPTA